MNLREKVESSVSSTDVLDVDIKAITKSAGISWIKRILIAVVWPDIKRELLKHVNPRIVDLLDDILRGL